MTAKTMIPMMIARMDQPLIAQHAAPARGRPAPPQATQPIARRSSIPIFGPGWVSRLHRCALEDLRHPTERAAGVPSKDGSKQWPEEAPPSRRLPFHPTGHPRAARSRLEVAPPSVYALTDAAFDYDVVRTFVLGETPRNRPDSEMLSSERGIAIDRPGRGLPDPAHLLVVSRLIPQVGEEVEDNVRFSPNEDAHLCRNEIGLRGVSVGDHDQMIAGLVPPESVPDVMSDLCEHS